MMRSRAVLAAQAARLNAQCGAPALPSLFFLTDPLRTPDPMRAVSALPRGAAVIYRHFGDPGRNRTARQLAALCRSRDLHLLIAADPLLAARVGAAGVHWPEQKLPSRPPPATLVTAAAHSATAVARAAEAGVHACLLGPLFPTRSAAANPALGLFRASQIARASPIPVIALGGVTTRNAARLSGRGFVGIAAIDALLEAER